MAFFSYGNFYGAISDLHLQSYGDGDDGWSLKTDKGEVHKLVFPRVISAEYVQHLFNSIFHSLYMNEYVLF